MNRPAAVVTVESGASSLEEEQAIAVRETHLALKDNQLTRGVSASSHLIGLNGETRGYWAACRRN